MGLKTFRPLTRRIASRLCLISGRSRRASPKRALVETKHKTGGRNNNGRITTRHIGGGHKQKYRIIDFKRKKTGEASVIAIEYDPNRTCRIALIRIRGQRARLHPRPVGLVVGDEVAPASGVEPKVG
jgi:large subunit ribosomal protein L2